MMNRRDFMQRMFGTAVTIAMPKLWTPSIVAPTYQWIASGMYNVSDDKVKNYVGRGLFIDGRWHK